MRRLSIGILLLVCTGAFAQDVLVVNPKTVKLRTDNDKVRVLEATLPPGVKENLHSHPSSVISVISGGKVRSHSPDGKSADLTFKAGDVIYRDPLTHWAENTGKTTIRLIIVEIK
jgi:quercetin dioxygenase-like cupin family protein